MVQLVPVGIGDGMEFGEPAHSQYSMLVVQPLPLHLGVHPKQRYCTVYTVQYMFLFFVFYSPLRFRVFIILFFTVLQCDLPPLRPHCGEAEIRTWDGQSRGMQGH